MRNIKGTLLDISSEENIIKLIFNNDIKNILYETLFHIVTLRMLLF